MTCGRTLPCQPDLRSMSAAAIAVQSRRSRSPAFVVAGIAKSTTLSRSVVMVTPAATTSPRPARRSGTRRSRVVGKKTTLTLRLPRFALISVLVGLEGVVDDPARLTALHEVAGLRVRYQHTDDAALDHRVEVAGERLALDAHRGDWICRRLGRRGRLACGGLRRLGLCTGGGGREKRRDQRQGDKALREKTWSEHR